MFELIAAINLSIGILILFPIALKGSIEIIFKGKENDNE